MQSVRSTFHRLKGVNWRKGIVDIIVAIPLLVLLTLFISWYFSLPALVQPIRDALCWVGEWCYDTYHAERGLFIAGAIGLVLTAGGSAVWFYTIVEPRREEQKKRDAQVAYIAGILDDPELTKAWVQRGFREPSHEDRADNPTP